MSALTVRDASLHGVKVIASQPVGDHRGFFIRTSDADTLAAAGIDHRRFVQESQSRSVRRTLRGLHGRRVLNEAKLFRCAHGAVFDTVVDLRPWSPTYLRSEGFTLDDRTHEQLYIPPGCVHGFQSLTEVSDVCYRMDEPYAPELILYLAYDDPALGIEWPLDDPIVSDRDRSAPTLAELEPQLGSFFGAAAPTS